MITPIDVAISQLGVREATGRNDGIPSERYQVNPYWLPGRPLDHRVRREPWCSQFVNWCFRASDWRPLDENEEEWWWMASALRMGRILSRRGWNVPDPACNDIAVFSARGGSDRATGHGAGHAAIVERVVDGKLHTIDGNWRNAVRRVVRNVDDRDLVAYFRMPIV